MLFFAVSVVFFIDMATCKRQKTTFVFEKGDKVSYENQYGIKSEGTYKVDGKKVTIKLKSWDQEKVYEFEVKDDKLDLTATDKYSPSYKGMEKK